MKRKALIIITFIYFLISLLYNYSLYPLLILNDNINQYFLILIYFLSELFSFLFLLYSKKNEIKLSIFLGLVVSAEESRYSSSLSNLSRSLVNLSYTKISSLQPFIGMKWISFILPSIFDFFSKFFIFNGLKILENDIIIRDIVGLLIIFLLSKFLLKSIYIQFSIIGVIIIFFSLVFVCFYCQISKDIKLYFNYNNLGIIGMLLCIGGEIFACIQTFFQIKYIKIGEKYCSRDIAWEGVFGSIISFIVFQFSLIVPCYDTDYNDDEILKKKFWYCCKDKSYSSYNNFFNNLRDKIIWYLAYFFPCIFINLLGITISKYIGEVYKSAVCISRLSIIMIIVLVVHNDNNSGVFNCIVCGLFFASILVGIFLAIFLRKERDITFEDGTPSIDLKDDYIEANFIDENKI